MNEDEPQSTRPEYDPTYLHSLRELYVIIALFSVFCVWSICVCFNLGYIGPEESRAEVPMVLGMPSWAFWGVFLPWIVVDIVAVWFCFFFMQPDDLGETHDGEDLAEQASSLDDESESSYE